MPAIRVTVANGDTEQVYNVTPHYAGDCPYNFTNSSGYVCVHIIDEEARRG
jgi:hypothetical protein